VDRFHTRPLISCLVYGEVAQKLGNQVHKTVKRALKPEQIQLVAFCNRKKPNGNGYKMLAVNRPGLLKFIWRSNKPNALVFSDWCAQVIDEILQTGRYEQNGNS
jgi:prophage antirepressor-like protein